LYEVIDRNQYKTRGYKNGSYNSFIKKKDLKVCVTAQHREMLATKGINKAITKTKNIYVLREDCTKFLYIDIFLIFILI